MDNDQRLTPLPHSVADIQTTHHQSVPSAYSVYYDDESLEGGRSIRQYFNVVYKRLPIILAISLIVTSAVALYMYKQPPQYVASAQLIIEQPKPKVTDKDSININFGGDANYTNTQLQLLRSQELMKDVVVDLGLYRDPDLFGAENPFFIQYPPYGKELDDSLKPEPINRFCYQRLRCGKSSARETPGAASG